MYPKKRSGEREAEEEEEARSAFVYLPSTYNETLQLWARIKSVEKEKFSHAPVSKYI